MSGLSELDWTRLIVQIRRKRCVPIIGPGINYGIMPRRSEIASEWSENFNIPNLNSAHHLNSNDLSQIAQYLAIQYEPVFPKEEMAEKIETASFPDYDLENQPHAFLAGLKLPIYLTTAYDKFLIGAFQKQEKRVEYDYYRWNKVLESNASSVLLKNGFKPTPATPLVYYLNGYYEFPESMVLTIDDYLQFLQSAAKESSLPVYIKKTLTRDSLLMLGFNPFQLDFHVLIRCIMFLNEESGWSRVSTTVQIPPFPPNTPDSVYKQAHDYINTYFSRLQMSVYWGSTESFILDLKNRMQATALPRSSPEQFDSFPATSRPTLNRLAEYLFQYFSKDELIILVNTGLMLDSDGFRQETKQILINDLLRHLQYSERLDDLINICQEKRPKVDWSETWKTPT